MKKLNTYLVMVVVILMVFILSSCSEHNGMGPEPYYDKTNVSLGAGNSDPDLIAFPNEKDYGYTDVGWVDPMDKTGDRATDIGWTDPRYQPPKDINPNVSHYSEDQKHTSGSNTKSIPDLKDSIREDLHILFGKLPPLD